MNESFHLDASLEFKRPKIDAPGMVPWNGMEFKRQNCIDSPSPKKLRLQYLVIVSSNGTGEVEEIR